MVTVMIQCPTEGVEYAVTAAGLFEALAGLEEAVADPGTQWQDMRFGTGAQKRRDLRKKELDKLANSDSDD
jgi:hypothetical protein